MLSVSSLVYTTTREDTSGLGFPRPLEWLFFSVHKVHFFWRVVRAKELYTNPNNYLALSAGYGLNFLFGRRGFLGESRCLRGIAQIVLIAHCLFECLEQQALVIESYREWKNAINGDYSYVPQVQWTQGKSYSLITHALSNRLKRRSAAAISRVKRIAACTSRLFVNLGVLSMKMLDAIEACSLDLSTQNESVCHLFVNGRRCFEKFLENREELFIELRDKKSIIQKFLVNSHSKYTIEQIIVEVSTLGGVHNTVMNLSDSVSNVGERVQEVASRVASVF